jgi:hypothetical protein
MGMLILIILSLLLFQLPNDPQTFVVVSASECIVKCCVGDDLVWALTQAFANESVNTSICVSLNVLHVYDMMRCIQYNAARLNNSVLKGKTSKLKVFAKTKNSNKRTLN